MPGAEPQGKLKESSSNDLPVATGGADMPVVPEKMTKAQMAEWLKQNGRDAPSKAAKKAVYIAAMRAVISA